jgi:hypothetical protein
MSLVGISLLSLAFSLPIILLPANLAVMILVIGSLSVLAVSGDPDQRKQSLDFERGEWFDRTGWRKGLGRAARVLIGLALVGGTAWYLGKGEWDTRGMIVFTLVMANAGGVFRRGMGAWASAFGVVLYLWLTNISVIQALLQVNPLHPLDLGMCALVGWLTSGSYFEIDDD